MKLRHFAHLLYLAPLAVAACVTNNETGRRGLVPLPDTMMNPMGVTAYAEMKAKEPVSTNAPLTAKVVEIAKRIADASGQKYDWEFTLFESKAVNAFCLPGGKIGIYTGILPVAKTNAGLAAVLGHEVAHAILKHSGERASEQLILAGVMLGADMTADALLKDAKLKPYIMGAIGLTAQFGVLLPYSRTHETEADEVGTRYMAKAGYDPAEAVTLWERMGAQGASPPEILSTHPNPANRAEALQKQQAAVRPLYDASQKVPTVAL